MTRVHPSASAYNKGCRCAECTQFNKRRMRRYRSAAHGRRSLYVRGCRCRPCTDANAAYSRKLNHKPGPEGTQAERLAARFEDFCWVRSQQAEQPGEPGDAKRWRVEEAGRRVGVATRAAWRLEAQRLRQAAAVLTTGWT